MRGLPFFKPKKGAQFAGLGFSDGSEGGSYVLPTASADTLGGVKVGSNLSIDANGVLSASDSVDPSMIAGTETTETSTHAYAIGDYFISSTGLLCKATSAIAIDDNISIGTGGGYNAVNVTVGGELSNLNSNINGIIADNSDLNDYTKTGYYSTLGTNNLTNSPVPDGYELGVIVFSMGDSGYLRQIALSSTATISNIIYSRSSANNVWTSWKSITFS